MCGIAGVFQFDGAAASREQLENMIAVMSHRGPDGSGVHAQGPLAIGMTRLAIIDVAGGQQPIFNEDGTVSIVCNGEIYNYRELRADLVRRGHSFRTASDVEVILHLYEDEGPDCFSRLNGMFSAAIADFQQNRLTLARDPFGQKPLYLWRRPGSLAFASELKSLVALPGFPRKVSPSALAAYLHFRYVPSPHCIFEAVEKMAPGSSITVELSGAVQARRYWQLNFTGAGRRSKASDIRDQLSQAVERHLMSERPLGVFLSGGLDSSAVVACMHRSGHREIHTYTVGFEDHEDNEFGTAREVARHFGTDHHEVFLTSSDFWDSLGEVVYAADEPLADLTTVPLYHLAQQASRDVVVVLSGEGSDELLAGYPGMEDLRKLSDRLRALRPLRPFARWLERFQWPEAASRKLHAAAGSDSDYLARNPYSITNVFDAAFRRGNASNGLVSEDPLKQVRRFYETRPEWNAVELSLGALTEWWLPDDLLHKADRMTMAHSIELRCPFLDTEFASYCAALDVNDKVRAGGGEPTRKIALKQAFSDMLPKNIAMQRKKGFALPAYKWLENLLMDKARAEMEREDALSSSVFPQAVRMDLAARASAGDKLSQYRVWSLIVLNKWGDRWL